MRKDREKMSGKESKIKGKKDEKREKKKGKRMGFTPTIWFNATPMLTFQ